MKELKVKCMSLESRKIRLSFWDGRQVYLSAQSHVTHVFATTYLILSVLSFYKAAFRAKGGTKTA